jgi:4-hydroxybenzoate polyprenyltransferase
MSEPSQPILTAAVPPRKALRMRDWIILLRPRQWVKNLFVVTPVVFSGRIAQAGVVMAALLACAAFCLLSSAVYILNDIVDRAADRAHPTKRDRPVAAGLIGVREAAILGIALAGAGFTLSRLIHPTLGIIALAYLGLNILYTFWLKHVVLLDVFCIAAFFVLRLLAGTSAIEVVPSIWLLLCGGLLALYLGFAKRRHELMLLGEESARHRSVLSEYSAAFLDQMSIVLLSVTIVCYIMYTVSPEKVAEVGSHALTYSTAFVIYGVFRYLYLVHHRGRGSPTETLLTDRSLFVTIILWFLYCGWVIYRPF